MIMGAPTHVIVDHFRAGGPSPWWNLVVGPVSVLLGAVLGFYANKWTGRSARNDERAQMRIEEMQRSMTAAVVSATIRLSFALLRKDNDAKDVALADSIAAFDILRIQFEADYPSFMLMMREQRNEMEALAEPLQPGQGTDIHLQPLRAFREWLESWLHDPEKIEREIKQGSEDTARNQQRQRQVEAEVKPKV
jgi:hypothetical protein